MMLIIKQFKIIYLNSISGVIISVVNHDYKAGSISGVIISVLASSAH
jgi:hypothetical protein